MSDNGKFIDNLNSSLSVLEKLLGLNITTKDGELIYLNILPVAKYLKNEYKSFSVSILRSSKIDIQKIMSSILLLSSAVYADNKQVIKFTNIGNIRPLFDAVTCLQVNNGSSKYRKLSVDFLIGTLIELENNCITSKTDMSYRLIRCLLLLVLLGDTVSMPAMALSIQLLLEDGMGYTAEKQSVRESSTVLEASVMQLKKRFVTKRKDGTEVNIADKNIYNDAPVPPTRYNRLEQEYSKQQQPSRPVPPRRQPINQVPYNQTNQVPNSQPSQQYNTREEIQYPQPTRRNAESNKIYNQQVDNTIAIDREKSQEIKEQIRNTRRVVSTNTTENNSTTTDNPTKRKRVEMKGVSSFK